MKSKFKKIAGTIIAAMFLALLFAGIVPTPASAHALSSQASCYTHTCDGLLPQDYGCTTGAQAYVSKQYTEKYGYVETYMMYSHICNAFFVLLNSPIVQYLGANIHRTNPQASYSNNNNRLTYYLYSQMVGYNIKSEYFANIGIGDLGYNGVLIYKS